MQSLWNSLIVAGVGSVAVSALAVFAVMVARRSTFRWGRAVEYLALIPQSLPGIIIGIGFFWAFALAPFGMGSVLQGTVYAVIIAFGMRALPSAFGSVTPAIMQIGGELDNAARVSGADWLMTFFRVLRALITPAFAGALVLTFVIMLKEYSPAVFLSSADNNILEHEARVELLLSGVRGTAPSPALDRFRRLEHLARFTAEDTAPRSYGSRHPQARRSIL